MKEPNYERMLQIIDELGLVYVPAQMTARRRRWHSGETLAFPAHFVTENDGCKFTNEQRVMMAEFYRLVGDRYTCAAPPYNYPPRVRDAEVARFFKARHNLMS